MLHKLEKLPYDMDALRPFISKETLLVHYGKHHRNNLDKLNELIKGTVFENLLLDQIVLTAPSGAIFNNAAQAWNHSFYWKCLSPAGGGVPRGAIASAIQRDFGSFGAFKIEYARKALSTFGSGWIWLTLDDSGNLGISSTQNADSPLARGVTPLLVLDIWEHAYYLDHQNNRAKYLESFWHIVNWDFVAENYALALSERPFRIAHVRLKQAPEYAAREAAAHDMSGIEKLGSGAAAVLRRATSWRSPTAMRPRRSWAFGGGAP